LKYFVFPRRPTSFVLPYNRYSYNFKNVLKVKHAEMVVWISGTGLPPMFYAMGSCPASQNIEAMHGIKTL
jgi:hypothetical protein